MQTIETFVPITQTKAKLLDMVRQLHDTNCRRDRGESNQANSEVVLGGCQAGRKFFAHSGKGFSLTS
jgi:hypothetical protein